MKSSTKDVVVQHNKLIQGHYRTTLQEKRLILWLMAQIQPIDKDFERYSLKISDFAEMVGVENNHNIYKELEKITRNLISRVIELEIVDEKKLIQVSFFSSAIYNKQDGTVDFTFDPALKPYLLELKKHYTVLSLNTMLHFSSNYAIRIYELLKQYKSVGSRIISLEDLRKYLGLESRYKLYASIKDRVIKFAEREINQKSDLYFKYEEIKAGKKVIAVKFIIEENERFTNKKLETHEVVNLNDDSNKSIDTEHNIAKKLIKVWGVSEQIAIELTKTHSHSTIEEAITFVRKTLDKKDLYNVGAYLVKAIQNSWRIKSSSDVQQLVTEGAVLNHIQSATDPNWRDVLQSMRTTFGDATYTSWFVHMHVKERRSNTLYLEIASPFKADYIRSNYLKHIVRFWQKSLQDDTAGTVLSVDQSLNV